SVPDSPEVSRKVTKTVTIYPADSGTWNARFGTWGSWGVSWEGHPYTAAQGTFGGSGTLVGPAFHGSAIKALGADSITKARLRIIGAGQGYGWTPAVRVVTQGSKPAGQPTQTGPTVTGPSLSYREKGWVDLNADQRELLRTGTGRGVAL